MLTHARRTGDARSQRFSPSPPARLAHPSHLRRRRAGFMQHALAQSLGIALAGLRKNHDLPCQHFVGEVMAISKPKGDQGHFERKAHDPDRLRVELLAIEVEPDGHGAPEWGTSALDRTYGTSWIPRRYGNRPTRLESTALDCRLGEYSKRGYWPVCGEA
jgi:hypothetical protein